MSDHLDLGLRPEERGEFWAPRRLEDLLRVSYRIAKGDFARTKSEFRDRVRYDDDAALLLWALFSTQYDRAFAPMFARMAQEQRKESELPGQPRTRTTKPSERTTETRPRTVTEPEAAGDPTNPTPETPTEPEPTLSAHRALSSNIYLRHIEGFSIQLFGSSPKPLLACTVRELRSWQRQSGQMSRYIDVICHGMTDEMVPGTVLTRDELVQLWQQHAADETA